MRGTRHSEEQIIAILKQGDRRVKTAELRRLRIPREDEQDSGVNAKSVRGKAKPFRAEDEQ